MSIFTKIIDRTADADIIYENQDVIVIKDIAPQAPIHLLVIPKVEIKSLQAVKDNELSVVSQMIKAVQIVAKNLNIEKAYRLVVNNGKQAGQSIFHLHFHLLAGKNMTENF